MKRTIPRRLIVCIFLGLPLAGCGGGDPVPRPVAAPEPAAGPKVAAADSAAGVPLLGAGAGGERLLPRARTAEQTTIDALSRIGSSSVPALVTVLHDPNPELRRDAAKALARIGSDASEAVPDLIAALDDKDAEVRKFATRALGEIGPAASKAVPALIKELRQNAKATEQAAESESPGTYAPATGAAPPRSK